MTTIPNWSLGSGTGTTITCTLGFTPTAGKILLCCVGWDKSASSFTTPSGFTALGQAIGASVSGAMFYKVATGSETSVAVTATNAPSSGGNVWVGEIDATSVVDYTSPTYSDTNVASVSTETATGTGFAVAMMAVDSYSQINAAAGSWSNSFTEHPGGSPHSGIFWDSGNLGQAPVVIAYKDVTGSAETTFTSGDTTDQMWAAIAIFATATIVTVTAADSVTVSDAATRQVTLVRASSDTVTAGDTASRVLTLLRSAADAVSAGHVATRVVSLARTAADAVTAGHTASRVVTLARSAADAVTAGHVASRVVTLLRSTADGVTATDAATGLRVIIRTAVDTVTVTDAATRTVSLIRSAAQTITASDVAARIVALVRSAAQAVGIIDSSTASVTPAETPTGAGQPPRLLATDRPPRPMVSNASPRTELHPDTPRSMVTNHDPRSSARSDRPRGSAR